MALFHLHVTQVKRSAGQSVVTSAAYRAGEKLYSEYYGEVSDYTHKGGVAEKLVRRWRFDTPSILLNKRFSRLYKR